MAKSNAATVQEYLEELPEERSGEVYEIEDRVRAQSARAQGAGR